LQRIVKFKFKTTVEAGKVDEKRKK
jgi:hypothetical protein